MSCGHRAGSAAKSNVPRSTITPPSDVPCPPRYLVAECTTMSAPKSFTRCRYGVATVWSITRGTRAARATRGDRADVEHLRVRIGDRLGEQRARGRPDRRGPGIRVVLVDERDLDAPVGERVLQQVDGSAVQLLGRDDVLALLRERQQRERDRGLAGSDRRGGDPVLELGDALLEHEHGRVGRPAVDVALASEREQVARLAQRGELERVRLMDRRDGGVLGDAGDIARLHLRRREGSGCLGHPSIVEQAARSRPIVCRTVAPR